MEGVAEPKFKLLIYDRALNEIDQVEQYYEDQQPNLGIRFKKSVFDAFNSLQINPYYQIRYSTFRCLPLKKFPFMVHYELDEEKRVIFVYAVINTYLDPSQSWLTEKS